MTRHSGTRRVERNLRLRLRRLWTADWQPLEDLERSGVRICRRRCLMLVLVADGFTQSEIAQAFAVSRGAVAKHIQQARLACAAAPQIIDHIAEIGWTQDSGCAGARPVSLYG